MVLRRRFKKFIQVGGAIAVLGFISVIVYSWNAFSHREIDDFVQDSKHYVARKTGVKAGKDDAYKDRELGGPLAEAVRKADANADGFLAVEEIEKWIVANTQRHLNEGENGIAKEFRESDRDRNSQISWKEFSIWLKSHPSTDKHETPKTMPDLKEEWAVADSDHNSVLSAHEFLCFRHPELCKETLRQLTKDVVTNLDKNSDKVLTEEEYTAPPPGQVEEGFQDYEQKFKEQRKREFQAIDTDRNGLATEDELEVFLNPRNHIHAKTEAEELIDAADENEDGRLSFAEIDKHRDLFQQSKLMDVSETFHNDF